MCWAFVAVQVRHVDLNRSTDDDDPCMLVAESSSPLAEEGTAVGVFLHINVTDDAPPPLSHPALSQPDLYSPTATNLRSPFATYTPPYDTFQALMNAEMLSGGYSSLEITAPADRRIVLEDGLDGLKCYFLSVLEWVYCIPEFVRLSDDDKSVLIKRSWCDLCTLLFAVHNRSASFTGTLVLGNGLTFQTNQIQDLAFQDVVDRVLNEVTSWFESMDISKVEIAHMKALLLFNSGESDNN